MAKPSPIHAGSPTLVSIGRAIRATRKAQALSQEELALACELDRSYVGGIERGEHNLTVLNLIKIASTLSVSGADLLKQAKV